MSEFLAANPQPPPLDVPRVTLARRAVLAVAAGWKAFTMRFPGGGGTSGSRWSWWSYSGRLGATRRDYASEVGDGRGNAIVAACIQKVVRTFPEAPAVVSSRKPATSGMSGTPEWMPEPDSALQQLLERPNPHYSGLLLWAGTIADYLLGNAYWLKSRSAAARTVELWWAPSYLMEPKWSDSGTEYISHYDYQVNGSTYKIAPEDVVHFRNGLDPDNPRKGLSPLGALLREIATDNSAANWTASLLRNLGVPGVVLSPGDDVEVSPEEAQLIKSEFQQRFGGDRMGEPLVMSGKTQVSVLAFNPQQMVLRELRQITEERISAVFGTPAVVVGLGAGLARSTYSNMAEAREDLYESLLVPMQRMLAADLNTQLVPDFGDPSRLRVAFDLGQVRVLQEDQNALHERARADLVGGVITLNEARAAIGADPTPEGDVYFIPSTVTPTEPDNLIPPEPEPMALPAPADGQDEPAALTARAAGRTNGHAKVLVSVE